MSDRTPAFKLEVNVPVWLEIVPHEDFGFDPKKYDNEAKVIVQDGKKKQIPASSSWMFNVVDPKGVATVWFCNREKAKDAIMEMAQAEATVAEQVKIAIMLFVDDRKHYFCLYAASTGIRMVPDHEIPIRFNEFCGSPAPMAAPVKPGLPPEPLAGQAKPAAKPAPGPSAPAAANGKLTWAEARIQLQEALKASANAWFHLLDVAFQAKEKAAVDGDDVAIATANENYEIIKAAMTGGISTSAHTMWIDVMRQGKGGAR